MVQIKMQGIIYIGQYMTRKNDNIKISESIPSLWRYKRHDRTTWKYIDFIMGGCEEAGTLYVKQWVKNPDFRFNHLCKD